MNSLRIKQVAVNDLLPYPNNARTHTDDQVAQIAASIKEFGWTNPLIVHENTVVAGHARLAAARKLNLDKVPCIDRSDMSEAQWKAYVLADNRLAQNAGWDEGLLKLELMELDSLDFNLDLLGFDENEINKLLQGNPEEGLTDPDEIPEDVEPVTQPGDLWILGEHRLLCGDSTDPAHVARLMNGQKAALIHADPPYGMGKESEGIANDNLYREKLDAFQMKWWKAARLHVEDNGSAYIWGTAPDLWRLWYKGGLADSERLTVRNEVVWSKGSAGAGGISHMGAEGHRQYPTGSEHCLFFMLGEQGFNNNADNYWDGWEPIRAALEADMKKMGWTVKDLNRITGTQMGGHWVTKSQWALITAEHYSKLHAAAREHDAFKRDFYATRAYFDNTHDNMTDVWEFPRVTGEERYDHATPKPVAMMERVMRSSLPSSGICYEPFAGSGSTLMAAEMTGRKCYTMEIDPHYTDTTVARWEAFTGQKAERHGKT